MVLSIFIARIVAVIYFSLGLGMLIDHDHYKKAFEKMLSESGVLLMGGYMGIVLGLLLVTIHNQWVMDWTVLVTLIGWGMLVKGIMLLVLPDTMIRISQPLVKDKNLHGVAVAILILGVVFGYFGFLA